MEKSKLTPEEITIFILSILGGVFAIYWSGHLIYGYHCANILWNVMLPMTELVGELIFGLLLLVSATFLLIDKIRSALLYRFTGIFAILFSISTIILDCFENISFFTVLWYFIFLSIGLLLYLFFKHKRYTENLEYNKILFIIALSLTILIDIIFYNWTYPKIFFS